MYTTVYFIPPDLSWKPTLEELVRVIDYFQCESVILSLYGAPLDATEYPPKPMQQSYNIAPSEALRIFRQQQHVAARFTFDRLPWKIGVSIRRMIPDRVADGYVAWDAGCSIGPRVIWDTLQEHQLFTTQFVFKLSGDGMPTDPKLYLQLLMEVPEIVGLNRFLKSLTGQPWQPLISCNY